MKVIGTAGHVDHGKSNLVKRLTGIDPDRLAEERARGMTIDLGFAFLRLPSGAEVSIVDVPGHERFVKNMLAGAGGIDAALLVVAADEGVMPQTREHLDILDLLGVSAGVVALTKADLVDEELIVLVADEVQETLVGTSLEASPIFPVSAVTGAGVDELLEGLDRIVTSARSPVAPEIYLPIDRVFTVAGFGTVVTGTLQGGEIHLGDELEILPRSHSVRVRGLQMHGRRAESVVAGNRVAANLAGVALEDVQRGDVLAGADRLAPIQRFDAFARVLRRPDVALRHGASLSLHIGTLEQSVTISTLGSDAIAPGEAGWIQIRSPKALVAVKGQPFVLRLPSPVGTVAGGEVVDVKPRHRRSDPEAISRLHAFRSDDSEAVVRAVLSDGGVRDVHDVARRGGLSGAQAEAALTRLARDEAAINLGGSWVSRERWESVRRRVEDVLRDYHRQFPLRAGIAREELRSRVGLARPEWLVALDRLANQQVVALERDVVSIPGHRGGTTGRETDAARVLAVLRKDPFSPPSGADLFQQSAVDESFLSAMEEEGLVVRAGPGLYFARDAYCRLVAATLEMIDEEGETTVSAVRDAFGTSRKYALALLEHLDAEHVTRRRGDVRIRGNKPAPCA